MQQNRLTSLLNIKYPIIQGGMQWVTDWRLAAASSNAGILGTLGLASMSQEDVAENIRQMKARTDKSFAVNIPLLHPDAPQIFRVALDEGVKIFITSAGNPDKMAETVRKKDIVWIHVIPSVRGAVKAAKAGAHAVISEGYEAGGHNSPYEITTLSLVPQVVDAVDVPVVAAGGIADGRGIAAAMALGAEGVQLGTRFIATKECPAHENFKKLVLDALDTGTSIIGRKLDILRVLKTDFAERITNAENKCASREELMKIIGDEFNRNYAGSLKGDIKEGVFQAGQSAGMVKEVLPVADLVNRLIVEYDKAIERLVTLSK